MILRVWMVSGWKTLECEGRMKKYKILYIDPPWLYGDRKLIRLDGKVPKAGMGASNHYPCMTVDELEKLSILNICDYPCAIFLWVTGPFAHDLECNPVRIITGWNQYATLEKHKFRYCNKAFIWEKVTSSGKPFPGRGHWNFHNTEDCLLFMRGSMPLQTYIDAKGKKRIRIVHEETRVQHPRDDDNKIIHSRKPAIVRDKIVQMFGDVPRIELFATERVPGWDSTGFDVDGMDLRDFLQGKLPGLPERLKLLERKAG